MVESTRSVEHLVPVPVRTTSWTLPASRAVFQVVSVLAVSCCTRESASHHINALEKVCFTKFFLKPAKNILHVGGQLKVHETSSAE